MAWESNYKPGQVISIINKHEKIRILLERKQIQPRGYWKVTKIYPDGRRFPNITISEEKFLEVLEEPEDEA